MLTNKKKSQSNRSQFIRSLAVCSAVLGLGAGYVANPIQAKSSPVKVRTNRQMKKGVTVRTTGKNAVYNKAGVLNSAKVVVNKKRTGAMGKSKRSGHYFRAYRVAKLSNGAVYYKVVSFDGKYRGWVYGGRSINKINGGLKSVKTTKAVKAPNKNNVYQFKAGQSVWKHPERSVYKNGKVLGSTTKYTKHELKVTKAVRLTREGTIYYYVKNQTQPKLSGWIKASGLKLVSRGNAEADKAPDLIETLPNLPGTGGNDSGNGNENGGGGIIIPEPELPGTTDPIKPGEPNESGDGTGTEETPDPGDNSGESETDGSEDGSGETPDPGDNGGENETDEPEDGSEETPDPGDNSGESETDVEDTEEEQKDYSQLINFIFRSDLGDQKGPLRDIFKVMSMEDGSEPWVPTGWLAEFIKENFSNDDPSSYRVTNLSSEILEGTDSFREQSSLNLSLENEKEYDWLELVTLFNDKYWKYTNGYDRIEYTISSEGKKSGNMIILHVSSGSMKFKEYDIPKIMTGSDWKNEKDLVEIQANYNMIISYESN